MMRDFMTADINEHYLEALRRYFEASEDNQTKELWTLRLTLCLLICGSLLRLPTRTTAS